VVYYEAVVEYIRRCPGPYFRELTRELGIPVGTLQYWLGRLVEWGELYLLNLWRRPRYFHAATPREEAEVIYIVRELKLSPALASDLPVEVRPHLLRAVVEKYPCVRQDLVEVFIAMFSQL